MSCTRKDIILCAQSHIGKKESNGTHKPIVDTYNSMKPLPRGYKVKYTDHWCATFISALGIECKATDIIPRECSCYYFINEAKKKGIWKESDSYIPLPGDIILYDWNDSGKGDNQGTPDHIGIVEAVNGNKILVIEGNFSEAVKRRTISVNGKYIRGYVVPNYDKEETKTETKTEKPIIRKTATDPARSKSEHIAGTYVTTANLNLRNGAGTHKKSMVVIPKGTKVKNFGYYTLYGGYRWLYIQVTVAGVIYTGFSSIKYLDKEE